MTAQIPSRNSALDHGSHQVEHDWETPKTLAETIVSKIVDLENVDQDELTPLYETVDMEAVEDVLLTPRGTPRENTSVEFSYRTYDIQVHSDGVVMIHEMNSNP